MSILKTIPIALDLKRVGAQAQALPTLVEGDNGNIFVITLTDDGEPLDLSTASRVLCVFSKTSDGRTVEQDTDEGSVVIGGADHNVITIHLKAGSYGAGTNNCEVQIYSGENSDVLVTTANFNFRGRKGIMNDETIQSEEKYPILITLITQVMQALAEALPYDNVTASAQTLTPGADATAEVISDEDSVTFEFGIPTGVGVASVALISGDHSPGTTDVYRMTFTNGTYIDFSVYNGADGTGAVLSVNGKTGNVVLSTSDVGAEPSGAVSAHDGSASAHASLFSGKQDTISDLAAIRSGAADGVTALAGVAAITEIKVDTPAVGTWTAASPHSSDTDGTYSERLSIPITGVTDGMLAEVTFGVADAASGEYSPICECYNGGVYIWAKSQSAPTILSVLVHK